MKTYARVVDGLVLEIIEPLVVDGVEVPIEQRFHPDFVSQLSEYDPLDPPPPPPEPPELPLTVRIATLRASVREHLDLQAAALGFDSMTAAATYAEEPVVPRLQLMGRTLRAWRSRCHDDCDSSIAKWLAGEIAEPTPAELVAQLPPFDDAEAFGATVSA